MSPPFNRSDLIESQMPVVESMIDGFVGRNPRFRGVSDDLKSVGYLKIIETVDRFFRENRQFDAHFRNYCRISIVTAVANFIRSNSIIRAPKNQWVRCVSLPTDPAIPLSTIRPSSFEMDDPLSDELTEYEALWLIFESLQDSKDIAIVQAKLDGATSTQAVSDRTGLSVSTVRRRLRSIFRRYQAARNDDS